MKVLIFSGFGSCVLTPTMKKIMKENKFPFNRVGKIIEYIESKAVDKTGSDIFEIRKWLNEDLENIAICVDCNQKFYLVGDGDGGSDNFSISDVDITRPWTIEEYDGSEYVKYLDRYGVIKELNYYKEN